VKIRVRKTRTVLTAQEYINRMAWLIAKKVERQVLTLGGKGGVKK
jgi:hypothetical protein